MPYKRSSMRYAHIAGFTSAIYQGDGKRIITAGNDGELRIWESMFDDDASSSCVAENVWAVLQYDDRILVGSDLNLVQAYKFPEIEKDGIEFRFTAFVTSLVRNGQFLAAGSEDGMIKVKSLGEKAEEFELGGQNGPVLSMDLSAKNLLAASCGDGKLRVWDLTTKKLLKTVDGLRKVKSFEGCAFFATPSFDPRHGGLLAFPKGSEIVVLNTNTWEQHKVLKSEEVTTDIACGVFSPLAEYYAAANAEGEIVVWDYKTGKVINGQKATVDSYPISMITWNPSNNGELLICDDQGQMGSVTDICIDTDEDDDNDLMEMAEKEADGVINQDDDDDVDIHDIYTKHVAAKKIVDEESKDDENTISVLDIKSQYAAMDDGQSADDHGGTESHHSEADDDDDAQSVASAKLKTFLMQKYFQSSSTPDHLEHRYLVYNHVGIVRAHSDDRENYIEVEFHDSSQHHGIHMKNFLNHTMAGLSESVLAMACPAGSESKSSKLVCINFVAFGNREWSCTMPGTEEIIGVIASDKIVVVATDARLLRVFTSRGTQREVLSIPGPLVSLAAYGDHFLVAYHRSPASEDQHLNLMVITCVNYKLRCREIPIPLSAESKLRWLGYSDKGSPVIYDSEGIMRLYHAASNLWFPILDAEDHKVGASDSLFIVKVSESTREAHIIVCRGAKYPQTNPRPIPMNAKLQVPVCEMDSEKGGLENELLQSIYFRHDDAEKLMKETAIKLFALACRAEMDQRAKELIETIASSQLIPLASKYAKKINRVHVAESLASLQPTFQEQEKEEERHELEMIRENAAMVSELEHINLEAVTKKDKAPKIEPIPVARKNPFKKSQSAANSPATRNPLRHLTSNAIGFPSPSAFDNSSGSVQQSGTADNGVTNENLPKSGANTPTSSTPSNGQKFPAWFERNKTQLVEEYPTASEQELIKIALKQFRTLNTYLTPQAGNEKRKRDDGEQGESGVAKLAKFGFVKN
ncbi:WD repeat and HMG-box DNA-binding protein 1 [Armigeres subalbatus]|uniref:WD repeat and HMG-box DNA-binding protein 1 n=1 Tax=Armigeres subalbatus TaxID=124917 RepID=UPI002ED5ABCB